MTKVCRPEGDLQVSLARSPSAEDQNPRDVSGTVGKWVFSFSINQKERSTWEHYSYNTRRRDYLQFRHLLHNLRDGPPLQMHARHVCFAVTGADSPALLGAANLKVITWWAPRLTSHSLHLWFPHVQSLLFSQRWTESSHSLLHIRQASFISQRKSHTYLYWECWALEYMTSVGERAGESYLYIYILLIGKMKRWLSLGVIIFRSDSDCAVKLWFLGCWEWTIGRERGIEFQLDARIQLQEKCMRFRQFSLYQTFYLRNYGKSKWFNGHYKILANQNIALS